MNNPDKYVEHQKLEKLSQEQRNAIQDFINYLQDNHYRLFLENDVQVHFQDAFYDFFGIDVAQLQKERTEIIKKHG